VATQHRVKTLIDAPYTDESIDSLPEVKHLSNYKASFVTINNGMKSASLVPLGSMVATPVVGVGY
jgi:hypothetical protein